VPFAVTVVTGMWNLRCARLGGQAVLIERPSHDFGVAVRIEDDLVAAVVHIRPGPVEGPEIR
jgi:hypothetical protein